MCFDTDPVNRTFSGYRAFGVGTVRLGARPDEIDPRRFDRLIERIMALGASNRRARRTPRRPGGAPTTPETAPQTAVVIDNGASTFLPLLGYLVESDAAAVRRGRSCAAAAR